jgi:hypothetical protein
LNYKHNFSALSFSKLAAATAAGCSMEGARGRRAQVALKFPTANATWKILNDKKYYCDYLFSAPEHTASILITLLCLKTLSLNHKDEVKSAFYHESFRMLLPRRGTLCAPEGRQITSIHTHTHHLL